MRKYHLFAIAIYLTAFLLGTVYFLTISDSKDSYRDGVFVMSESVTEALSEKSGMSCQ